MIKQILSTLIIVLALAQITSAKELKPKRTFKVPDGYSVVGTFDINLDKIRDYIVQAPSKVLIYNGVTNNVQYTILLDSTADESVYFDNINTNRLTRSDLIRDVNANGVCEIPIRGLNNQTGEYLRLVDAQTGEKLIDTRFSFNTDNLYIYDADGNDTLDVVIERLDSVLIFSGSLRPTFVESLPFQTFLAHLSTFPNPTRDFSTIVWKQFGMKDGEEALVVIIDMQGREIERITSPIQSQTAEFKWNGRTKANTKVPDGVYFVKATTSTATSEGKIIVGQ